MPKISSKNINNFNAPQSPVVLAILDGWGHREEISNNAIKTANTPIMDSLWHAYPHTLISASGSDVGLPDGQMGNSEVGHLTIGSGRIIQQELVRISNVVKNNKLGLIDELNEMATSLKKNNSTLHITGLCSDGGVHSHIDHLLGLIKWASDNGIKKVAIHIITDGRDTPAKSALKYLDQIESCIQKYNTGEIASICGRYWIMDRNLLWDRTEKAHSNLTDPNIKATNISPQDYIKKSYDKNITDEFIEPIRISENYMKDGDSLICFNFRPDRARQIIKSLSQKNFLDFERKFFPILDLITFTQYDENFNVKIAFPPESLNNFVGQIVSENGLKQYRTAETEKYPHVTYFFNGGVEIPLPGEDRHLIPSPRVATYDMEPEMSAEELTISCSKAIKSGKYAFIVINFANPDMVGHTGNMNATTKAIETVDKCIGQIVNSTGEMGGSILITADHGNAEVMKGPSGEPWTAHTTNKVPLIFIEGEKRKIPNMGNEIYLRDNAGLADIAPTLLQLLNLPIPKEMTGKSLIKEVELKGYNKVVQHV
ncbi:2,3-bisphosphoglycerate-independent phosphoglycerate mutase [Prochlorococcus marinus str. MIT 9321]|uniref:2,3-bisphosphoglycerate-independent phosphoglycerate mutase n=1 Tax=Prochlorococcus marinus str. MIT 9401 TaxID=167551 RepID=A0A0A2BCG5_PROMR|nr:2,3-bisphosphoglycerate-independent phosphoglycerate mutase [Prochlorococcus marinus]KGG02632.1 2,3-bisphosphoglycerate-independent phosphoglycerate mutase [Prochlorococcus marinus str. MIT 9321]KGG05267.1 2,3-bisphosphoglycerate-independent phosphoglycerate mutase [Prochlorococcus marinus str. MIT 9322]KGG10329.1 2,3-bisphosphoglycerate-independent phosphoglycerate mutase [Prochlorococcus marinus str. MIT 9401]